MSFLKTALSETKKAFGSRSSRVGGYSLLSSVMFIAIVVAINVLAGILPDSWMRRDISKGAFYTLCDESKAITKKLDKEVTLYWIVQSGNEDATVETLLNRYAELSKYIKVKSVDPDVNPTFTEQYTSLTIYNNSVIVTDGERSRYVSYYDIYSYDTTTYEQTGDTNDISWSFAGESAITSAIDYPAKEDLPDIYKLKGHGEADLTSHYQPSITEQNMVLTLFSLLEEETVPEEAEVVLVNVPENDLSPAEIEMLDAYMARGGKIMIVTDALTEEDFPNLVAFLAKIGVHPVKGLVCENASSYYYYYQHYLLPSLNSAHSVTSALASAKKYVFFPVSQGISVDETLPEGVAVDELLTTTSQSYSKIAGYEMSTLSKEEGDIDGPFALAIAANVTQADSETVASVIWVSSSALVNEEANTMVSGTNMDLFLNSIGWLVGESEDELTIHSKAIEYNYLSVNESQKSLLMTIFVIVVPALFLAAGVVIVVRRKKR